MSKAISIAGGALRQEMGRARVIMGYLLGLTFLAMGLHDFLGYAAEIGEPVNVMEAFIVTAHQSMAGRFWVMGYLLILADAPFVRGNTALILYRSGRRAWSAGMAIYVLIQAFLYAACFAVFSALASLPRGFFGGLWSSPVYLLATNTSEAVARKYQVFFEGMAMMRQMTVWEGFGITFLYLFCYLALLGMLLYVCSLLPGGFWGLVAAAVTHLGGVVVSFFTALPWSPASFIDSTGSHWKYPGLSLAFLLILALLLLSVIGRVDLDTRTEGGA